MSKEAIQKGIIAAADKKYTDFKASLDSVIQDKFEDMLDLVVKEKAKSIFEK
jgi:hypothetical protein